MGAKQSKRSVDISAGTTKAEKGPAGEPLENGTITTASTDEKPVVEVNGAVEETLKQNGSTPHVDEKETVETAPAVEEIKESTQTEETTEVAAPAPEANGDLDVTVDESAKSPTDESATTEEQEKKRKKKKSWSFRNSFSFSKKDKSKPIIKEQATGDVKTETVQEVAEEDTVKEEAKPETESAVEIPKIVTEISSVVVEVKEFVSELLNTTSVSEIPPPLPSSPPPVETPAVPTPTIIETPAPVQPAEPEVAQAEPEVVQSEPEVQAEPEVAQVKAEVVVKAEPVVPEVVATEPEDDTVGGGEGLAEPPEGLNTSDIEKEAEAPLVNGNHVENDKSEPIQKETSSPDVTCLSEKIEAIKLSNADIGEVINAISNDLHEVNGVSDAIAVTNGDGGEQ